MPHFFPPNFFRTIRYFNRYIGLQAHEPVYLLRRLWRGPWRTGTPSSYRYNTTTDTYEFDLYVPTIPETGGKPRLHSLQMFLDGVQMTPVVKWDDATSDNEFWVEIDHDGPTYTGGDTYGRQVVGFNVAFVPTGHVIEYRYEEICHCVDVGEESYHPDSRCTICYGTAFVGGYTQYIVAENWEGNVMMKPANTILCRFPITTEAVKINRYGAEIITQRKSWSIANPILRDWDVLVRTRAKGAPVNIDPEFRTIPDERYFIADIEYSTARASYDLPVGATPDFDPVRSGITLHQKFAAVEAQPEHIIYQVPHVS